MSAVQRKARAAVALQDTPIYDRVFEETYGPSPITPNRPATSDPVPLWVYGLIAVAAVALWVAAVVL